MSCHSFVKGLNVQQGSLLFFHWLCSTKISKFTHSQEIVLCCCLYLSGQRHFDRHRYELCQETAVEGHHEHHWVVVREHKCNLQVFVHTVHVMI